MKSKQIGKRSILLAGLVGLVTVAPAEPQTQVKPLPRPEAVAETRLLMDGLAQANFRGLAQLLQQKPEGTEAWTFARGQALLIAETANLLMLRPPRQGPTMWLDRAADLRTAATRLARAAAARDYDRSRTGLAELAGTCNRCHQSFRVSVRVTPSGTPADRNPRPPVP